ncbi:MAG: PilN domain-containing protein [bacterium]|nr:PilN domain-containing protein [bacterium]
MIKINLLPRGREQKKKEGLREQIVVLVAAVVILFFLIGMLHSRIGGQITSTQKKISDTTTEIARLDEMIKEVKDIEVKRKNLEDKLNVIENLEKGRVGAVMFMDKLSLMPPEKLWLTSLSENQGKVNLTGNAIDNPTVAKFMDNLDKSGVFRDVAFGSSNKIMYEKYRMVSFNLSLRAALPGMGIETNPAAPASSKKGK